MERRAALWVAISLSFLGMLGCGNSKLTSVSLNPAVADAHNFPGGQVQYTATGTYSSSSKVVRLTNVTWCIGSTTGACNGNIATSASVDGHGLAQCLPGATGTVTVIAGSGGPQSLPDGGHQLAVFGTAQLTCP
jgi:outer membrane lipoprotein SlyB